MSNPPEHKLRWYQYKLSSLFVLTTLVAIACSWYANEMQKAAKRRKAIAEIQELGRGVEYYDASNPPSHVAGNGRSGVARTVCWGRCRRAYLRCESFSHKLVSDERAAEMSLTMKDHIPRQNGRFSKDSIPRPVTTHRGACWRH